MRCVFLVTFATTFALNCSVICDGLYFRIYMRRGSTNSGDGRRLIFVGTQPDLITLHYVKHNLETGMMKLKKVRYLSLLRCM